MKTLNSVQASELSTGTSLKGYINGTYSQLIEILGEPTYNETSGDGKVNFEWVVESNGEIFTVYDWKTYSAMYSMEGLTTWNVGGKTSAFDFIQEVEKLINK